MTVIVLHMAGAPRGQGRPRATSRGGFASVYKAPKDRMYENSIRAVAQAHMGATPPLTGALSVTLNFRIEPPKSLSKRARAALLTGEVPYLGAFDLDNLVKSVLDGCNAVCFADDKQVVRLFATKVADEHPGVDLRIEALEPQEIAE